VWPIQLGFMDLARVLVAWCEMRQAFRFFRTDRLASAVEGDRYPARRVDLVRRFQDVISMVKVAAQTPDRN
jgi:predicted DNA-binding transcriptional regulator YafY